MAKTRATTAPDQPSTATHATINPPGYVTSAPFGTYPGAFPERAPVLALRLHLWDLCSPRWNWSGQRWTNGNSWLRPVPIPAVDARLVYDHAGRVAVVLRERAGTPNPTTSIDHEPVAVADARTVIAEVHGSATDYLTVLVEPDRVRLFAGTEDEDQWAGLRR